MAVATKRGIRYHPQGAACRGEAPPRPYVLVVYPHVIDGLGTGTSFLMGVCTNRYALPTDR